MTDTNSETKPALGEEPKATLVKWAWSQLVICPYFTIFQAFAAVQLWSLFFWDLEQREWVKGGRRFENYVLISSSRVKMCKKEITGQFHP